MGSTARSRFARGGGAALVAWLGATGMGITSWVGPADAAPPKGLANPKNDKAVVALATKALACEWGEHGLAWDCPGYKAWKESPLLADGKADGTLVAMLADAKEPTRWLAAEALLSLGKSYKKDKAMADGILAAASAETSAALANSLGRVVGYLDSKGLGVEAKVKDLATKHALPDLRAGVVSNMLWSNEDLYDFVLELGRKEKDETVRKAAVSAPWVGTPSGRNADSCKFWLEKVDDASPNIAGEAAYLCAFYPHDGGCKAQWDPLLTKVDAKAKAGQVGSGQFVSGLRYLRDQKEATPAQKSRALNVAKTVLANEKNSGMARGNALALIGSAEREKAKPLAKRYENDKEFWLKSSAKKILEGKYDD